jgi:hypothetical protein
MFQRHYQSPFKTGSKMKWTTNQIKTQLHECVTQSKGAQDPYHEAFQDLIVSRGKSLGLEVEYGKFEGK